MVDRMYLPESGVGLTGQPAVSELSETLPVDKLLLLLRPVVSS